MKCDLVVVGNISYDTVRYQTSLESRFFGGGGLNVAIAAWSFGIFPRLVSVIGVENESLVIQLSKYIDTTAIQCVGGKTCQFEIVYSEDGFLKDVKCEYGVSELLNKHFDTLPLYPVHYHVCCRSPLDSGRVLSRLVREKHRFSVDFTVSSIKKQIEQTHEWIPHADCVLLNKKEFDIFSDYINPMIVSRIIVTSANQPVKVIEHGRIVLERACPKVAFLDVTGAGDAFIGSYLANFIKGMPLSTTVDNSILCAQATLGGLGVWRLFPEHGSLL